ncbi:MAG: hypothetical protein EOP04_03200 [Proteobacteria bacterium]|nr:MAG: hypothetical protein EOP04_03200 [Pseudomonadota bacterium]
MRFLQQFQSPVDDGPSETAYRWVNANWSVQKDFSALRFAYRVNYSKNWMGEISSGEFMILTNNSGVRVNESANVSNLEQVQLKSYLQKEFSKDHYFYPQLSMGYHF